MRNEIDRTRKEISDESYDQDNGALLNEFLYYLRVNEKGRRPLTAIHKNSSREEIFDNFRASILHP